MKCIAALIATLTFSTLAFAAQITSAALAENAFFTQSHAKTLMDLVDGSGMTASHKKEVAAYLRGKKIENAPVPNSYWAEGSSFIAVGEKSNELKFDLSNMPSKQQISVNGVLIGGKSAAFYEIIRQIEKAVQPQKHSNVLFRWLEPIAYAQEDSKTLSRDPVSEFIYGGIMYWSALDQSLACGGNENVTKSKCVFQSNTEMIKKDLGSYDFYKYSLVNFECTGNKIKSIAVANDYGMKGIEMSYNTQGLQKASVITGASRCDMTFHDGKIVSVIPQGKKYSADTNPCNGMTLSAYSHTLRPGDQPTAFEKVAAPISRLNSCCSDNECKTEISAMVNKGKGPVDGFPGNNR